MPEDQIKSQEPTLEAIAKIAQIVKDVVREAKEPKDPTALYANNTSFEVSAWDLKMFFGQLDQRPSKMGPDWHTTVTIPWTHAKLFEYFLRLNILFYEKKYGPITLPPQVRPQPYPYPTEEQINSDPQAIELWEAYSAVYREMFGATNTDAIEKNVDRLGLGGEK